MLKDTTFVEALPPKGESPYDIDTDEEPVPSANAPTRRRVEDNSPITVGATSQRISPTLDHPLRGRRYPEHSAGAK